MMASSSESLWRHSPRKLLCRLVDFLRFDLAIERGLLVALDCSETRVELESIDLRPIRSLLEFVIGVDVAAFEIGRWWPVLSTNRARSESEPIKLFEIVFVVGVARFSDWLNWRIAFLKLRIFEKLLLRKHGIFHLKIVFWSNPFSFILHPRNFRYVIPPTHLHWYRFRQYKKSCISLDTNKLIKNWFMSQSKISPRHKLNHMLPPLSVIFPTIQLSFFWYTDCSTIWFFMVQRL